MISFYQSKIAMSAIERSEQIKVPEELFKVELGEKKKGKRI